MSTHGRAPVSRAKATREELRLRRQEAILDLSLEIVSTEGHDALTMQRLADELECGIASVYRLFPSKDALVAELLHHALDVLHASWLLGRERLSADAAAHGLSPAAVALARAVGAAWFWVAADHGHRPQVDLARRLLVDRRLVLPPEQADLVLPAAHRLLDATREALDDAVAADVLRPGDGDVRATGLVAALTGVVLTAEIDRWVRSEDGGAHLAELTLRDSFAAWGAEPAALEAVVELVVEAGHRGRLDPAVPAPSTLRR